MRMLLPKDKFDNRHIDKLDKLSDEEIAPLIPPLLEWLQDYNFPIAKDVLQILKRREDIVVPHILTVFEGEDTMWKYWMMELLIPSFSPAHQAEMKGALQKLMSPNSSDEDAQCLAETAAECYNKYFGEG